MALVLGLNIWTGLGRGTKKGELKARESHEWGMRATGLGEREGLEASKDFSHWIRIQRRFMISRGRELDSSTNGS